TEPVLPVIMLRASGLEWYSSSSIAARILRSTPGVKRCAELMYFETVAIETPARAATSRMVGFFFIEFPATGLGKAGRADGKRFRRFYRRVKNCFGRVALTTPEGSRHNEENVFLKTCPTLFATPRSSNVSC